MLIVVSCVVCFCSQWRFFDNCGGGGTRISLNYDSYNIKKLNRLSSKKSITIKIISMKTIKNYTNELKRQLGYNTAWLPGTPVKLGYLMLVIFIISTCSLAAQSTMNKDGKPKLGLPVPKSKTPTPKTNSKIDLIASFSIGETITEGKVSGYNELILVVTCPAQEEFKDYKIKVVIDKSAFSLKKENIRFPFKDHLVVSDKEVKDSFMIMYKLDSEKQKAIKFKLKAFDKENKEVTLKEGTTKKTVLINPVSSLSAGNNEFWLFTGSNLDLLDGPKFKDLYFKGSYLQNLLNNQEKSNQWFYITFGKNRLFSDTMKLMGIELEEMVERISEDSANYKLGEYSANVSTKVNNIFTSFDYLYSPNVLQTKSSRLFSSIGFRVELQEFEDQYHDHSFNRLDTMKGIYTERYFGRPLREKFKYRQFNSKINIGLIYILTNNKVNIKTKLQAGYHVKSYPISGGSNSYQSVRTLNDGLFFNIGLDAVVLRSGVSIGFETILERSRLPDFNVSITKVFDITQLGNVFGGVSQAKVGSTSK